MRKLSEGQAPDRGRRTPCRRWHAAAALVMMLPAPSAFAAAFPEDLADGWNLLTQCGDFRSADGRYVIAFRENGSLDMSTGTRPGTPAHATPGSWSYEGAPRRYMVAVAGARAAFELFVPPDSRICVLGTPSAAQADLGRSWYAPRGDP